MKSPIIIALDTDKKSVFELIEKIDPSECKVKVGSQLFTASGPIIIEKLNDLGFDVFLDLKFHDIPNTVEKSIEEAVKMGVWMLNVHSLGGKQMLNAALQVIEKATVKPLLIGVTVLTSFSNETLKQVGINQSTQEQVLLLAKLCQNIGLDGVVCSPNEVSTLRENLGKNFLLVTPGIRSLNLEKDDQKRTATATEAINNGADYIVIGREITKESDPGAKIKKILETV